ncbi:unnamed protein product [Paramecium sonneborni]|uniref:Cyclic nucleotide-binding domain-containing protein n=1 Tax=Paramecium sonneborni TaxID=65129 RepID=A0A8S1QU11_9CILI|nr:unnamed protein product [Paramecium sonneborni]
MYLISRLSKVHKSQEDIAAIQDYMSQLQQFHAPYEILKELCYSMNYKSFKHGEHVKNKSEYAYFILKGQILADNGDTYSIDSWYDLDYSFYVVVDTHCIIVPINIYKNFNHTHGSNFQYRKNILLQNITSIDKINSSKIQEKLIRTFIETTLSAGNIIYKQNESAQYLYVLSEGILQISRFYEKNMTHYEKQVLPKKYWQTEINICQLTNSGVIGEELLYQEYAFYNVKVISKIAVLQMISIKQLKNFLNINVVIQSLQDLFHDKHIQREEIYNQQCEEMEKNWQSTSKQMIINSEIKKSFSFKVLKSNSEKQTKNNSTNANKINISNTPNHQDEELAEFQRTKSPVKKIPNFIQQYFKQKQLESTKKTNEITLQQFIQRQQHCNNPYQLFEKVHDPLNYIQKGSNYKRQQFSVLIQNGIVKIKNPQIPKQPKRPITSYLGDESSTNNNNNNNDNSLQQPARLLVKSVHTPKPIVNSLKKFYRCQSANKTKGFSLLGKSYQQQSSPRDNMFYLRSNSSHNFKLTLNKSSNQKGILQISRFYEKNMTHYEKQVLPKKYWQTEINICQLTNSGVIGEELLYQEYAFYNVKVISKIAVLQMISIKQLKNFLNINVVIQSLQDLFHDKHIQREEIYNQQCEEMEKNWQSTSKQMIINSEIKKSFSFKVLKSNSEKQTKNNSTNANKINISNTPNHQDEELAEFQRTKSPVKKIPNFIQQYFKQKQLESTKKTNEITLQQFIQRQQHCNNPYQLFEKVHDPLNYIQKGSNYKRQQFSVLIQNGIVKIKNPQIPKQPKRPITSYLGDESSTNNNNNNNDNSLQQPARLLVKSVHTPKPIVNSLKKFYRCQSANKTKGFSLLGKSYQQQSSPRDNMFYLRSNSSHNFKLTLNKSSNQSQQLQVCYTDKKIQCEESLL